MAKLSRPVRMATGAVYTFFQSYDMPTLVAAYRSAQSQIDDCDRHSFADAHAFECSQNDRACLARQRAELGAELNERFQRVRAYYDAAGIMRADSFDLTDFLGASAARRRHSQALAA